MKEFVTLFDLVELKFIKKIYLKSKWRLEKISTTIMAETEEFQSLPVLSHFERVPFRIGLTY